MRYIDDITMISQYVQTHARTSMPVLYVCVYVCPWICTNLLPNSSFKGGDSEKLIEGGFQQDKLHPEILGTVDGVGQQVLHHMIQPLNLAWGLGMGKQWFTCSQVGMRWVCMKIGSNRVSHGIPGIIFLVEDDLMTGGAPLTSRQERHRAGDMFLRSLRTQRRTPWGAGTRGLSETTLIWINMDYPKKLGNTLW